MDSCLDETVLLFFNGIIPECDICHSRAGGNPMFTTAFDGLMPSLFLYESLDSTFKICSAKAKWIPACAGMTGRFIVSVTGNFPEEWQGILLW